MLCRCLPRIVQCHRHPAHPQERDAARTARPRGQAPRQPGQPVTVHISPDRQPRQIPVGSQEARALRGETFPHRTRDIPQGDDRLGYRPFEVRGCVSTITGPRMAARLVHQDGQRDPPLTAPVPATMLAGQGAARCSQA